MTLRIRRLCRHRVPMELACARCTYEKQQALKTVAKPVREITSKGAARNPDHHTSIAASLHNLGNRSGQRFRIITAFYESRSGLTDEEAAIAADVAPQSSPWKRCTELREWGYLAYAGIDRPTTTGSPAKVWRLTAAGERAFRVARAQDD